MDRCGTSDHNRPIPEICFDRVELFDKAYPLLGHLRYVNTMKTLILLFRVFYLFGCLLSVIDMFAKQFGYGNPGTQGRGAIYCLQCKLGCWFGGMEFYQHDLRGINVMPITQHIVIRFAYNPCCINLYR